MKNLAKETFCGMLLKNKVGYNYARAVRIYDQLTDADEDLQIAAVNWISSNEEPLFEAEGWSVGRLMTELGMNALAAILTIDWLRKDPKTAIVAINDGIQ